MDKIEYNLKSVIEPNIVSRVILNDNGAFGIKIVYTVNYYRVWYKLGKFKICNPIPYKTEEKVYLRPLKQFWSSERGRLPKNEWGWKTHPLCGVVFWWEVECDYGYDKVPILKEQIKDHTLIKRLRSATISDETRIKKLGFNPKKFNFYK